MNQLYLDNASTTPIANEILKEINDNINFYANPSSRHSLGQNVKIKLEKAREKIAKSINSKPEEIIFTSGATESNNLAIIGLTKANPNKKHIIISKIEHPSIIETCKFLEKEGYKIDLISVNKEGIINLEELKNKITKNTLLVSIMHVNNEIGTIQPIEEIGKICKEKRILFHTDAVQSFGKLPINVEHQGINLLSASGHKINAPKGIGFLYIKNGTPINPIINGGGQEKNLRSGTENFLGIIALSKALELKRETEKIKKSRDKIINELLKIPGSKLNGSRENRIYNNINVSFYGIEGESLQMLLDEEKIFVSTGSACSSHKLAGSHVLKAIGVDELHLNGSIRITLDTISPLTKKQEDYLIKKIKENVEKLTKISPFKLK